MGLHELFQISTDLFTWSERVKVAVVGGSGDLYSAVLRAARAHPGRIFVQAGRADRTIAALLRRSYRGEGREWNRNSTKIRAMPLSSASFAK
jgi:hypothetical protein